MAVEFPTKWALYDDVTGATTLDVDLTSIFNPDKISRLTIADTQADVLAAGAAKRLFPRTEEASKGAIKVAGRPLSSFTLGKAAMDGVPRFLIAALGFWNRKEAQRRFRNRGRRLWR